MLSNMTFLMIFAFFDPSPLTLDKLQFLVLITVILRVKPKPQFTPFVLRRIDKYLDTLLASQAARKTARLGPATIAKSGNRKMADCASYY